MSEDDPPRHARRVPLWVLVGFGVIAGAVVGLGAAMLVGNGDDDGDAPTLTLAESDAVYPADQAANATAFLTAWERYRRATFVAELSFERLLPNGEKIETDRTVVQDPPRRLVRQGASVTTSDEDASLLCDPVGDQTVCTQQAGVDYDASVLDELLQWHLAIDGDAPPYAVDAPEDGCFELRLVQADMISPPYGDLTRVCFDAESGALRSRQVTRSTGTDTETATSISATVTDEDWALGDG